MANRFWVGGSGNSNSTTKWSTTSGGSSGASVPGTGDAAIFDANSFSADGQTVTVPSGDGGFWVQDATFSAIDQQINVVINNTSGGFSVGRNFTGNSNVTWSGVAGGEVKFLYSGGGGTITTNNAPFGTDVRFSNFGGFNTETKSVVGEIITPGKTVYMFDLTVNTQGISAGSMLIQEANVGPTWNPGSTTNTFTGSFTVSGFTTINAGNATIAFTGSSAHTFAGNGKTYGTLSNTGSGVLSVTGSNTFATLNFDANTTNRFTAGTTTTLTTGLVIGGFASNLTTINSLSAGSPFTLTKSSGLISEDYMSIKDSTATGGASWYAGANSTNVSGNSGWIFTAPPPLVETLTDHFDSYTGGAPWWSFNNITMDGVLTLDVIANTIQYSGISSAVNYTLTGSSATVRLVDPGDMSHDTWEVFPINMYIDANNQIQFLVYQDKIQARKRVAGTPTNLGEQTYNANTHRFLRIRESGGTVFFEYSSNRTSWNILGTTTTPFSLTSLIIEPSAGAWDTSMSSANAAVLDEFNIDTHVSSISGSMILTGSVTNNTVMYREFSGTFQMNGTVSFIVQSIAATIDRKTYVYKVYDPDTGDFLGTWSDVVSEFGFSQEVNSAGSAIEVTLARNSDTRIQEYDVLADDTNDPLITDDNNQITAETRTINAIGPGTTVDLNLDVKIYVFGPNSDPEGDLIFQGYISKYVTQYGSSEQTKVSIFSYGADLDHWVLEDANGNTRVPYFSMDPSDILKDTLDKFNADGGIVTYDGTSIDDTSTVATYRFNLNTELEAVKTALKIAPTDWFFYVDLATNLVHFHPRPTVPDHTFVLGKHVLELNLEKYIEELTNTVYFSGGELAESTNETTSFQFLQGANSTTDTNAYTFSSQNLGAAHEERYIMVAAAARIAGTTELTLTSLTVGGITADIVDQHFNDASNSNSVAVAIAKVPTGTTGNVVVTWSGTGLRCGIGMWRVVGLTDTAAFDVKKSTATNPTTATFKYPGQGIAIGVGASGNGTATWAGLTENYDVSVETNMNFTVASGDFNLGKTDQTVTYTPSVASESVGMFLSWKLEDVGGKNLFKKYEDAPSIAAYRRGLVRYQDNRVTLESSADIISESLIDRGKEPRYRSNITIADKVYDIETIKLGQLVAFRNFGNFVDEVTMQIVRIDYSPDRVVLQLDTLLPSVPKRLEDLKRNLNQTDVVDNPDAPAV